MQSEGKFPPNMVETCFKPCPEPPEVTVHSPIPFKDFLPGPHHTTGMHSASPCWDARTMLMVDTSYPGSAALVSERMRGWAGSPPSHIPLGWRRRKQRGRLLPAAWPPGLACLHWGVHASGFPLAFPFHPALLGPSARKAGNAFPPLPRHHHRHVRPVALPPTLGMKPQPFSEV